MLFEESYNPLNNLKNWKWNCFSMQLFSYLSIWFSHWILNSWVCCTRPSCDFIWPHCKRVTFFTLQGYLFNPAETYKTRKYYLGNRRHLNDHQKHVNHKQSFRRKNRKSSEQINGNKLNPAYHFKGKQCTVGRNSDGRKRLHCSDEVK